MIDSDLYDRQRRLAQVGAAGQSRIERAALRIPARGDGVGIELAYLVRAGVASVTVTADAAAEPFGHAEWFRFGPTREVAAGAWRALGSLRRIVEEREP